MVNVRPLSLFLRDSLGESIHNHSLHYRAPEFRDSTMLLSAIVHFVAITSLSSFCEFLLSTPSPLCHPSFTRCGNNKQSLCSLKLCTLFSSVSFFLSLILYSYLISYMLAMI